MTLNNTNKKFQELLLSATHVQQDFDQINAIHIPSSTPQSVIDGVNKTKQEYENAINSINTSAIMQTIEDSINGILNTIEQMQQQINLLQSQVSKLSVHE